MRASLTALLLYLCLAPAAHAGSKVQICHRGGPTTQLISVSTSAWGAHQAHGDTLPATFFADSDLDGYGDGSASTLACAPPAGFVANSTDCDDDEPSTHPGSPETCNGIDDDCDAATDEGAIGTPWHLDADIDGFGNPSVTLVRCTLPIGYTSDATDCDDGDPGINPNASETCSPVDDDCDGIVNESDAVDAASWYEDVDLDGFGGGSLAVSACEAPAGWVSSFDDCDDADADAYPGGPERCDGIDNDCDGVSDEDAADALSWYLDADADGFGEAESVLLSCEPPVGHVADASDCDDGTAAVSPEAVEWCDTIDDDCDGVTDEPDAIDASTWYADADHDGFGAVDAWAIACTEPAGYVAVPTDCDDADPWTYPGSWELCGDGLDQTCDGEIDDGCAPPVLATFPLEVIGANGTIVSMTFPLDAADVTRPTLYLQIHDLDFDGEGAVRLNDGPWWELQDELDPGDVGSTADTVHVEVLAAAAGYGGLGGLFGTLKLEVSLPPGALLAGENTLSFQFVHTDGVTSGFRVLDVDLLDGAGDGLFADTDFAHADPDDWTPIYTDDASIAEGERLWREAPLTEPNNGPIGVHCADCHTQDGRDLKYFGYSDHSIIARAEFHELTHLQGEQIASYIRSLEVPSPGRPWNPPYQPGPGTDDKPPEEWAAGAGIEWVLDEDEDTIDYAFPNGITADAILNDDFRMRNIPIAMMLLDWNHWLPDVHPLEGLPRLTGTDHTVGVDGVRLSEPSDVFEAGLYRHYGGSPVEAGAGILYQLSVRDQFANATHAERCALGEAQLNRLSVDLKQMLEVSPTFVSNDEVITPDLLGEGRVVNSLARWFLVKRFELHQEFGLEDCGLEIDGPTGESRSWFGNLADSIPGVTGMSQEGAPNYDPRAPDMARDYASHAWWTLQAIHNTSPNRGNCRAALWWQPYVRDGFAHLGTSSGEVQTGRMLAMFTVAFRDVADREGVSVCDGPGWQPLDRGSVSWLGLDAFARWERRWSPTGEELPWGSYDVRDPALVRHSHAEIMAAYWNAFVQVSREHPLEEYTSSNDGEPPWLPFPVVDHDYAGCTWEGCLTEPGYVDTHGILWPDPVNASGTFEKWSFAATLKNMLTESRDLFVDLATRQALADFAVTVFPNIDWQSMVDDFGPRRTVTFPADDMYPAVDVSVDPGAYAGSWSAPGSDPESHFVGPRSLPMAPGKNQIVVDGYGEFHVLVYPDGLVVPFDPVQATGGQQSLVFANASVSIATNGWEGHWGFFEQEFAPGDRQMVLVPGLDYKLQIGVPNTASFRVDGPGAISTTTPASLVIDGTIVTFRTAPITFERGDYAGWYGFEYGPSTIGGGTENLVTGFTYPLNIGGWGGSIALTVAEDGTPSVPDGAPYTVVDQTVWFDPQFLTVTTAAPLWSIWGDLFYSGTQTIGIMPGATYVFNWIPSEYVLVDEACNASPADFTLDGYLYSLSCASEDPTRPLWYADLDGDGFGDPGTGRSGTEPRPWETAVTGDCDDASAAVNPASTETTGDGIDADCSGGSDWDGDGDGHTAPGAPDGTQDDCDDGDAGVFAGNVELCDGRPNGCQPDGTVIDEAGIATWFPPFGTPVDLTGLLAGAPGAPVVYALPSAGEVVLCDGTWHATLLALAATDVTLRSQNGAETTIVSPEGQDRVLLIDSSAANVMVEGLTLTNGVAPTFTANGAYDCGGGGITLRSGALVLRDSVVTGNTACGDGGGIRSAYSAQTLEIYDSSITDNSAQYTGGITADAGSAWIERSEVDGNAGATGGISSHVPLTVMDSSISFNSGGELGGITTTAAVDLISVTIEGNVGPGVTSQGVVQLTDSLVAFNTTDGLYAYGGTIELTDTLVSDNGRRGALILLGGTVECHGQVGLEAGFLRNPWAAAVLDTSAANRFTSDVCDFGTPDPGWESSQFVAEQVFLSAGPRYAFGDDATFVCTSTGCL